MNPPSVVEWPIRSGDDPSKFSGNTSWPEVAGVTFDSEGNVYVFNRGPQPVVVFNQNGEFVRSWGEGKLVRPHGIEMGPDGCLYCTDDGEHTVKKFDRSGNLLACFGNAGRPSETGATSVDFRSIKKSSGPFHYPTNVAFSPNGTFYVADGYGNARVHQFTLEGKLVRSWGNPGSGPGEFHVPHGIAVDGAGKVLVADRENSRIQFFSPEGELLDIWNEIARPCQVALDSEGLIYVAELGYRAGMWPGTLPPSPDATGGRVSIYSPRKELLCRWGGGQNPTAPGDFFAPHDICVTNTGAVYVTEVVWSAGASRGLVSPDCHSIQKFQFQ